MHKQFAILNNFLGWIVWAIATVTYFVTIEPSASFWDCSEYIACAYKLEIGHPPGAPLFLIIGRLFALLGGGPTNAAMMINVMSALSSSFTILFLFWTITRLGAKSFKVRISEFTRGHQYAVLGAGAVGALAYTFSDTFWFNAVEGEVYALSSFFTALVFWSILKWEEEDNINSNSALRWLVLISYLIGLSIGVHLLNLLVIPAIVFVVFLKKYECSWKRFLFAGILSLTLLGFIQNLIIPKIVKFLSDYEVFFTNELHLGFNTGSVSFVILLITSLTFFILYTITKKKWHYRMAFIATAAFSLFAVLSAPSLSGVVTRALMLSAILFTIYKFKGNTVKLNAVFLGFAAFLIGYSSFFILAIRSQSNPPIDENDPENATNMLAYLQRDVFGEAPLLYGPYYNAPTRPKVEFDNADPVYVKDRINKKYKVINDKKNSIPKYDPEFCTFFPRMYVSYPQCTEGYNYWGEVKDYHRPGLIIGKAGDSTKVEIPTMHANLNYFFKYQLNFMYWRYFMWNFVGRQNDVQGRTGNNMDGNWLTGFKRFDDFKLKTDTSKIISRNRNNLSANHFYALPFLLGVLGICFHFRRSRFDAWVVMCFFLMTGVAIIVYLNQAPYEGRECDYAYAGSFYAFTIWIGFGVLFIYHLIKRSGSIIAAVVATALGLVVPVIMAQQGWNDHDRSNRTLARDMAINYLQSCPPNAILFTNGDNGTFPLWYAQEVEGVRTDVRICNLSLLMTDWYIKQMRRAVYDSPPVPFTIPDEKLEADKMPYLIIKNQDTLSMRLSDALTKAVSNDTTIKISNKGKFIDVLPANKFFMDVDSFNVMHNKVISVKDVNRLSKRIVWNIAERSYIVKSELMLLDLIAHNDWKRPICFAVTTGEESYLGLKSYWQLEGLVYRFVPIKQTEGEAAAGGRVNTEVMYNNVMNKFLWGGMDKKVVSLDENCLRVAGDLKMQMSTLATALIKEGETKKARNVLDKCLTMMPERNVPYDANILKICDAYYQLNENRKASELTCKLFGIYENDLKVYNSQEEVERASYSNQIAEAEEILQRVVDLTKRFKEDDLNKELAARLGKIATKKIK
ncbi:MAG: DUF2723 domain-containing protein [Bacteroidetes bacterium]|nr:DUF2723 domain-containing protein [Bacteroidota bacterium]